MDLIRTVALVFVVVTAPSYMGMDDTHAIPCGEGYAFPAQILNPVEDTECHIKDVWVMVCLKSSPDICIGEKL